MNNGLHLTVLSSCFSRSCANIPWNQVMNLEWKFSFMRVYFFSGDAVPVGGLGNLKAKYLYSFFADIEDGRETRG